MSVTPITPDEVIKQRLDGVPDKVIEIFNEMIVENWNTSGKYAIVDQDKVVTRIAAVMNVDRQIVFDKGWIDIEPIFRNVGWRVEYDKPAYYEDYSAYFKFSK